jgi:hypothetical protein
MRIYASKINRIKIIFYFVTEEMKEGILKFVFRCKAEVDSYKDTRGRFYSWIMAKLNFLRAV